MKQTMKATKMIAMGLFSLCAMGLSQATFASPKTDKPAELTFIGKVQDRPVFQLNMNNTESDEYFITIKNESHTVLYSEKIKAKDANFSRRYQLDISQDDLDASGFGVTVEVTSAKTHQTHAYKISSHTTVNENIIVAKL